MNNSVAIVTGASQGIGRSTSIRLAKDFGAVVLVARSGDALREVSEAVREAGAEPLNIALDLSLPDSPGTRYADTGDLTLETLMVSSCPHD
jgi:3-oxoacyl-[acyl-carrier protein] reductase